tara:strand:- start:391 stop:684 length:294 start_codon:yes stop_codon:yes gene_type:complete
MLTNSDIKEIIKTSIKDIIKDNKQICFDDFFIGPDSSIESIEIVQIIDSIEEILESNNIKGFDLFDSIFKFDKLSFEELADLIENELKEIKYDNNFR